MRFKRNTRRRVIIALGTFSIYMQNIIEKKRRFFLTQKSLSELYLEWAKLQIPLIVSSMEASAHGLRSPHHFCPRCLKNV